MPTHPTSGAFWSDQMPYEQLVQLFYEKLSCRYEYAFLSLTELKCYRAAVMRDPTLSALLRRYPIFQEAGRRLVERSIQYRRAIIDGDAPVGDEFVDDAHDPLMNSSRSLSEKWLQDHFSDGDPSQIPTIIEFLAQESQRECYKDQLNEQEKKRYQQRQREEVQTHVPILPYAEIQKDFYHYLCSWLLGRYKTNTTYGWKVLTQIWRWVNSGNHQQRRQNMRLLILALDDSRTSYHTFPENQKHVPGKDYGCLRFFEENLLDLISIVRASDHPTEKTPEEHILELLTDPFVVENPEGGRSPSDEMYAAYLSAAGYNMTQKSCEQYTLIHPIGSEQEKKVRQVYIRQRLDDLAHKHQALAELNALSKRSLDQRRQRDQLMSLLKPFYQQTFELDQPPKFLRRRLVKAQLHAQFEAELNIIPQQFELLPHQKNMGFDKLFEKQVQQQTFLEAPEEQVSDVVIGKRLAKTLFLGSEHAELVLSLFGQSIALKVKNPAFYGLKQMQVMAEQGLIPQERSPEWDPQAALSTYLAYINSLTDEYGSVTGFIPWFLRGSETLIRHTLLQHHEEEQILDSCSLVCSENSLIHCYADLRKQLWAESMQRIVKRAASLGLGWVIEMTESENFSEECLQDLWGEALSRHQGRSVLAILHNRRAREILSPKLNSSLMLKYAFEGATGVVQALLMIGVPCYKKPLLIIGDLYPQEEAEQGSALIAALRSQHIGTADLLLKSAADLGLAQLDEQHRTAMHWAEHYHYSDLLRRIIVSMPPDFISHHYDSCKTALIYAVEAGLLKRTKELISKKVDVDAQDYKGLTALCYAARSGNLQIAQVLIEAGAQINPQKKKKILSTALHEALIKGHSEVIQFLIRSGADIHAKNGFAQTPISVAVRYARTKPAQTLLDHGARVQEISSCEIGMGLREMSQEQFQAFQKMGVNFGACDKEQRTPLFYAAQWDNCGDLSLVVQAIGGLEWQDEQGNTPLIYAARKNSLAGVTQLLDLGANVHAENNDGDTALMCLAAYTASEVRRETVSLLLKSGSKKQQLNKLGQSAFRIAFENFQSNILSLLYFPGCELQALNNITPFQFVINNDHSELFNYLMRFDSISSDFRERTAKILGEIIEKNAQGVFEALYYPQLISTLSQTEQAHLLRAVLNRESPPDNIIGKFISELNFDAWDNISDLDDENKILLPSPRVILYKKILQSKTKNSDWIGLLRQLLQQSIAQEKDSPNRVEPEVNERIGFIEADFLEAVTKNNHDAVMKVYLECSRGLRWFNKQGQTLLMKAVHHRGVCVHDILERQSAEITKLMVDASDHKGETVLHKASIYGKANAVMQLLDHGANIYAVNKLGQTALMKAATFGHKNCAQKLLDAGASRECQDSLGNTAYDKAMQAGHTEMAEILKPVASLFFWNKSARHNALNVSRSTTP